MTNRYYGQYLSRLILLIFGTMMMTSLFGGSSGAQTVEDTRTAYNFSFTSLSGEDLPLSQFRGKVILIVNTASKCGFTGQYEGLEKLYRRYAPQGLIVIGVPSNDFGKQEPGSEKDIAHFCQLNYGVTFPMTAKENVIGANAHPFYLWARKRFGFVGQPKWNFHKYVIDRSGHLADYFHTLIKPDSKTITSEIEELLRQPAP